MTKNLVVALGGNALSPADEIDTIENQFTHTRATAKRLVRLLRSGWDGLVITHGNGPQVGNAVARVERARGIAPWLPLDICVADTQGGMGYMIQQCVANELGDLERTVVTLVTQVVVRADDTAFGDPTKPIGPTRRLVPSPAPIRIVEAEAIRAMCDSGTIVIAGGGGGVPVIETHAGLKGVEAVVDKDLTGALLATAVGAERFVILTGVDGVYVDFGRPSARKLDQVGVKELRELLSKGAFPPGSMGPKVHAACRFVAGSGNTAVIAHLDDLEEAAAGRAGTLILG